jgi:hypothetical protein
MNPFRERLFVDIIKKKKKKEKRKEKMLTCNRLVLETLGSRPIMPTIYLPGHWFQMNRWSLRHYNRFISRLEERLPIHSEGYILQFKRDKL